MTLQLYLLQQGQVVILFMNLNVKLPEETAVNDTETVRPVLAFLTHTYGSLL
jgi:hypothetical protein